MADHTNPFRTMDEFRRRYLPSTQEPHDFARDDLCRHCGRPFDDPIHDLASLDPPTKGKTTCE